jgi:hypothetical protein
MIMSKENKKSLIVSTSFLPGLFIFLLLITMPAIRFYQIAKAPFESFIRELSVSYSKLNIPSITYDNHEARSNNDKPYNAVYKDPKNNREFLVFIDTSKNPEKSYVEKIKKADGGLVLYRDRIVLYSSEKSQETNFLFSNIQPDFRLCLDQAFVDRFSSGLGKIIFFGVICVVLLFHAAGKLFWFLILSLYFSGRARLHGGGNYSLSLWILVPPTIYQTLFYEFKPCCGCGIYFIIMIISAILMDKELEQVKVEDE